MAEEISGDPTGDRELHREWSRSVSRGIESLSHKVDREVEKLGGKIEGLTLEVLNARIAVATLNERASFVDTIQLETRVRELEQQLARAKGMAVLLSIITGGLISLAVAIFTRVVFRQ